MAIPLADLLDIMETVAPSRLAEDWDNPGLQVGGKDWSVNKIWVSLDPTPEVVSAACQNGVNLLITHHPLIFKPIRSIDPGSAVGKSLELSLCNRMAIFSAHTNLDSVHGGVNDLLAEKIGLADAVPLQPANRANFYKLVVYVPAEDEHELLDALFDTGAGKIGKYHSCTFRNRGMGTFRPGPEAAHPTGETGEVSHADEIRVESVVHQDHLQQVVNHIRKHHPHENMAYDVYPLHDAASYADRSEGLGRIGGLGDPTDLAAFAAKIKTALGLSTVKCAGDPSLKISTVAVCSGSGSGLMPAFLKSSAEVYVSGDLRYHDARDAEAAGKAIVDVGHFASEHLVVRVLADHIRTSLEKIDKTIVVEACPIETDPFSIL